MSRAVNSIELVSHSHSGLKITIKTQKTLCRLTTEEQKNPKHYVFLLFALLFNFQPKSFDVMLNKHTVFLHKRLKIFLKLTFVFNVLNYPKLN